MSEIRVNNITNRDGSTGTTVAGIPVVDSNSHFVVPTGRTGQRYVDGGENIVRDGLVLHLDAKYSYPSKTGITATTDSLDPDVYTWYDLSGNENHGELINGVSYSGTNGGSLVFDGVNDTVVVGSKDSKLNPSQVTISVWLNRTSAINYSHFAGIPVSNNSWSPPYMSYGLEFISTGDNVSFVVGFTNTQFAYTTAENTGLTGIGTWVNVTGTYDENYRKIYINGNLITSIADNRKLATASGNFTLGAENYTQTNYPFNGKIPVCLVYNRALTAAEVLQNYNATKGRFGL
jgi:hypothetical protein